MPTLPPAGDPSINVDQNQTAQFYENFITTEQWGTATAGPFSGKTYLQIYQTIWNQVQSNQAKYASISPWQVFQYVAQYYVADKAGTVIQESFDAFAKVSGAINTGVLKGAQQVGAETSPSNWLSSLGGLIGSGLEGGFVALLKDIWAVIVGPLEIITGFIIVAVALGLAFKDDLLAVAGPIAMGAVLLCLQLSLFLRSSLLRLQ
jgi:hypothetical protein